MIVLVVLFALALCDNFVIHRRLFAWTVKESLISGRPDPTCKVSVTIKIDGRATSNKPTVDCFEESDADDDQKVLSGALVRANTTVPVLRNATADFALDCYERNCFSVFGDSCEFDGNCGLVVGDEKREQSDSANPFSCYFCFLITFDLLVQFGISFLRGMSFNRTIALDKFAITLGFTWNNVITTTQPTTTTKTTTMTTTTTSQTTMPTAPIATTEAPPPETEDTTDDLPIIITPEQPSGLGTQQLVIIIAVSASVGAICCIICVVCLVYFAFIRKKEEEYEKPEGNPLYVQQQQTNSEQQQQTEGPRYQAAPSRKQNFS
jgi:hypothetical protein